MSKSTLKRELTTALFPTLSTPVPVAQPDQPYDIALIWLSVSPRIVGTQLDATASMTIKPARIVGESVEIAPESAWQYVAIGSALGAVDTNPTMAQAILGISQSIAAALSE